MGSADERVQPGDALRFVYSATEPRYLAILSFDGARHASVYYPAGPTAEHVDPAVDGPLRSSTVLDATLGRETLYGVFGREPTPLEPLRAALEGTGKLPALEGCEVDAVSLRKEPPSGP